MRALRPPKPRRRKKPVDTPRVRLDVDARRALLLDLGLSLFGGRNYDEISIDDIAREASISKGLLYHYFGSKRGFYVATVRHAAQGLLEQLLPDSSLPPGERLASGLAAYLAFVEAHAPAYVALMRSGIGSDPEVLEIVETTRSAIVHRIQEEGLGLVEPRPVFRVAVKSFIGAVEAAALDWLDRRDVPSEVLVALLSKMLVHGLTVAAALDSTSIGQSTKTV